MKKMVIVADSSFVIETIRLALRSAAGLNVIGKVDGRHRRRRPIAGLPARHRPGGRDAELGARPRAHPRVPRGGASSSVILLLTMRMDDEWVGEAHRAPVPTPACPSPRTCRASHADPRDRGPQHRHGPPRLA